MPFREKDGVRYFTFASLDRPDLLHAAITRRGGASPDPWRSLNLGGTVGDETVRVIENRRRAFAALGLDLDSGYDVYQVHGDEVVCADAPRPPETPHIKADAILTNRPGVTLFMRFADCVPVYLYDPNRRVIGLAHAGWQGTVARTAGQAVRAMVKNYGSLPGDILAVIGPSIGPHHYPIGAEVADQVRQAFGADAESLLQPHYGNGQGIGAQFDLWSANRLVLQQEGLEKVEISGICTACHLEDWFSHRGEKGRTGRFGALMALQL